MTADIFGVATSKLSLHLPRLQQLHILLLRRGSIASASGLADMHRLLRRIVTSRNLHAHLGFSLVTRNCVCPVVVEVYVFAVAGWLVVFMFAWGRSALNLPQRPSRVALAWNNARRCPAFRATTIMDSRQTQTDKQIVDTSLPGPSVRTVACAMHAPSVRSSDQACLLGRAIRLDA